MRRSVARRIKAGLVAFTIIDAGVLFLGMARVQDAPHSVVGNAEVAMQPAALPPLFASVPNGAMKQDAAADGTTVPVLPAQAAAAPPMPEAVSVPAALLATAPAHDPAPAQRLASRAAKRMQAAYAQYHALPERETATPFSSAFDGASDTPPPNPYYLPDPGLELPEGLASHSAAQDAAAALDATAALDAPPGDVAAAAPVQDQAGLGSQQELAPAAQVAPQVTPDVSAVELPSLPVTGQAAAVPATP